MMSYWVVPNPVTGIHIIENRDGGHKQREDSCVKTEAGSGVLQLQVKKHPGLPATPETRKGPGRILP